VAHVDHRVQPGAEKIVGGHRMRSPKLPGTDIDWNQSWEFALLAFTPLSQRSCGVAEICRADSLDLQGTYVSRNRSEKHDAL
jgi:hypothetical protein